MYLNTDYIAPAELTGYTRAALADLPINQFRLRQFLPDVAIDDLDYRFTRGGAGLAEAAVYRAYDTEADIGSRPGVTRVSGELPPISRKIRLGEYDRLRQRNATGAITNGLFDDAERLTRAIAARVELARGEALYDGKIVLDENGIQAEVDFGRNPAHSAGASSSWTTPSTGTPIADLISWIDTYVANNNGVYPGGIIMSRQAFNAAVRTKEVRDFGGVGATIPSIVPAAKFNEMLAAFDIPPVIIYDAQVSVGGAAQRVIPADGVILVPGADSGVTLGSTLWGTTAESLQPNYGLSGDEPGIVAGVYDTNDPVAIWTKAAAIALPVLANPDLTFRAKAW